MVLNEGAVGAGAACHKIPRGTPGIGYVLAENDVTRVRIAYVTDDLIRALAAHFRGARAASRHRGPAGRGSARAAFPVSSEAPQPTRRCRP